MLINEAVFSFCLFYFIFFIADKRMTLRTQHIAAVALNPARDIGPRLFIFIAGWRDTYSVHNHYVFVPMVGPFIGAIAACGVYDYVIVPEEVKPADIRRRYWNK
ncbi:hypothetical protein FBU59_002794 [Linderina macrospora]|uniref:Uncharacterized protein n=1 Tax=Linderina macrospora TaxID=4868 RepID=A0ACC1JAA7_9FUNG|nr:hypothetical protein FBU59_002794 [Linderina macrospora]